MTNEDLFVLSKIALVVLGIGLIYVGLYAWLDKNL